MRTIVTEDLGAVLEPPFVDLDDGSVAARLSFDETTGSWIVFVLITRRRGRDLGEPPIQGENVSARLIDEDGEELPVEERPSGDLREASGGLGASAGAPFRMRGTDTRPLALIVQYAGRTCRFEVRWPESGSEDER
jgi:hypothetical protein